MDEQQESSQLEPLGQGRSAVVFRGINNAQQQVAVKIFTGSKAANLVHYVFSGAPNPYCWNEDAIRCGYYRRRILYHLCQYWFCDKLSVSQALSYGWNEQHLAHYLETVLIQGKEAALHHPFSENQEHEFPELIKEIMQPLQQKLLESGFDGLVWQAGKGNPVATNNFLLDHSQNKWFWIDLESGVPALIPINIATLFSFYLPKSWHHGCALFDDVDIPKLRDYLEQNSQAIAGSIGEETLQNLMQDVDCLAQHQHQWKNMCRVDRSIQYNLKKQRITEEQAQWYSNHPVVWYIKLCARLVFRDAFSSALRLAKRGIAALRKIPYIKIITSSFRFIISQKYRATLAKSYVTSRVAEWYKRRKFSEKERDYLEHQINAQDTSSYITDFGFHISIKPIVKFIQYVVLPVLYAQGVMGGFLTFILILMGSAVLRSLYTGGRIVQSYIYGQRRPWVALFVGFLPVIGNLAYPAQMIYVTKDRDHIAGFILYDTFSKFGEFIPIWGGKDTHTEHFFNRFPDVLIRQRKPVEAL